MSKLNINRNLFLEREELLRFQEFMLESSVNQTFLANTINWGIIDTSGGTTPNDFKIETGSTSGTVKIANLSRALTESGLLIKQPAIDNIAITDDSNYYWIKIGHTYSNLESGTCSITVDGQVSGSGTAFTDVLRGQSTEVPVKIKFYNAVNNTGIYEVVQVVDDENIILQGTDFTAESNLTYFVVGSTPVGETITSQQQEGLYFYDSCIISIVAETVSDTEPAGKIANEEFWLARIINNSGTVTIEDKRDEYWEYYIRGVSDKLTKSNNLSDVDSSSVSRTNLDVYSKGETDDQITNALAVGFKLRLRANVSSAGTATKLDGDLLVSAVRNSTGKYTVTHNLGSTNYQILPSVTDAVAKTAKIGAVVISTNSFIIYVADDESENDADFTFSLIEFTT